jgi:hypothetical protein
LPSHSKMKSLMSLTAAAVAMKPPEPSTVELVVA